MMMWAGVRLRPGHILAAEPAEVGVLKTRRCPVTTVRNFSPLTEPTGFCSLILGKLGLSQTGRGAGKAPRDSPCHFIFPHLPLQGNSLPSEAAVTGLRSPLISSPKFPFC